MTPDMHGYYAITVPNPDGSGRAAIHVHRASWALHGGANESGVPIAEVWTRSDVGVDHVGGRKTLHAGHCKFAHDILACTCVCMC